MNKTIIININGIIFHIEEKAYTLLQNYMVGVQRHFGTSADSNEIVNDIENRIAEMFTERLNEQKAVINIQDVKEVCAQMGNVEDFGIEEDATSDYSDHSNDYKNDKSLFRDASDKVLGGVCSGLGHYFDIESKWIRLIFLVVFFFGGAGLLVYVVLWIAVPKAITRVDKMRMRGEPANLENFKKSFQEEMGDVKRNFSEAGEKMKTSLSKENSFIDSLGRIIVTFVKIIGSIIIVSLSLAIISLSIALLFGNDFWWGERAFDIDFPLYAVDPKFRTLLKTSLLFTVCIPLLTLIFLAIRVVFNRKVMGRTLGFSLLVAWLIAAGTSFYYIINTAIDFKEGATITQERSLLAEPMYQLNLRHANSIQFNENNTLDSTVNTNGLKRTVKHHNNSLNRSSRVYLYIQKAEAGQAPRIIENLTAKGRTFELAAERAESINYHTEQNGKNLWFSDQSIIQKEELFRDQKVSIKIIVPIGTRIIIPQDLRKTINIRGLPSFWDCEATYSANQSPLETEWIMTESGLKCFNSEIETTNSFPTDSVQKDSTVTN